MRVGELVRAIQLRTELLTRGLPLIIRMLGNERPDGKASSQSTLDDHFRYLGMNRRVLCQDSIPCKLFAKAKKCIIAY